MYYVYILKLKDGTFYIGYSQDLKSRIRMHQEGIVSYTKPRLPLELEFYASFKYKKLALDFEKYLKTSSGFAFRNKRLVRGSNSKKF